MTDEAPFQNIPEEDIRDVVVRDEDRPDRPDRPSEGEFIDRGLTDSVWGLIEISWTQEKTARPQFTELAARLRPLILYPEAGYNSAATVYRASSLETSVIDRLKRSVTRKSRPAGGPLTTPTAPILAAPPMATDQSSCKSSFSSAL